MKDKAGKGYGFDEDAGVNLATEFPVKTAAAPRPDQDQLREIAESQGFTSREPTAPQTAKEPKGQLLINGPRAIIDEFKAFGKAQEPKWTHWYTLKRALDALKREVG